MFRERDFNPLHWRRSHLSRNHAYALVTVFGLTAAGIGAVVGIKSLQGGANQGSEDPDGARIGVIKANTGEQVIVVVPSATATSEPPTATPTVFPTATIAPPIATSTPRPAIMPTIVRIEPAATPTARQEPAPVNTPSGPGIIAPPTSGEATPEPYVPLEFSDQSRAARMAELTNAKRLESGLRPLAIEPSLTLAATNYARLLAKIPGGPLSHVGPDGSTVLSRIEAAGYKNPSTFGENFAPASSSRVEFLATADMLLQGLMNSPGHRANILNSSFKDLGVGCYVYRQQVPWQNSLVLICVQNFGAK